jgi:Sec-independent protein secretion pathway component TatC
MLILGIPLCLLYEGSIWVVHYFAKRPPVQAESTEVESPLEGKSK